jgi:hypothetical protein
VPHAVIQIHPVCRYRQVATPIIDDANDFDAMARSYADTGGLLGADELAGRIAQSVSNSVGTVARWIVGRRVLSFQWQDGYWLPAFQFAPPSFTLRAPMDAVLEELVPVLDDWSLARWCCSPNEWLAGHTPANALHQYQREVVDAARAHRFALMG